MSEETESKNNTLSLGGGVPKCLSETQPEIYHVISWAISMTPNPTIEGIYKICGVADELQHLDQFEIRAAIAKVLEEKKEEEK